MNERERWLQQHLSYELLMLRHTHKQLHQVRIDSVHNQLVWNANFGAFAVYARNLYLFLTNDKTRATSGAEHYVTFDAEKMNRLAAS